MQVPYEWLQEFVDISDMSPREVAERLTMMGLEVEASAQIEGSVVFEVKVTPNRGDCLSMVGVARELSANTGRPLRHPDIHVEETGPAVDTMAAVEIRAPELCPRYSARVVTNVSIKPSPPWVGKRLLQCGMRPINNVVDATNLVMLELGQPLHAFDADLLAGDNGRYQIIVRRAREGEVITTLDGQQRMLSADMLVIADPEKAVAVAGVMGGANSEVNWGTSTLLLESAHFNRVSIRRTARELGLQSEASYRFERVVDPGGTIRAVDRLAQLIVEFGGGEVATGVVDAHPRPTLPVTISVRPEKVNAVLGTDLSPARITEYLRRIELEVAGESPLQVTVPTFRPDLVEEIDVVEEVARVHGYQNIAGRLLTGENLTGRLDDTVAMILRVEEILRGLGLSQAMTYSLEAPEAHDRMALPADSPLRRAVVLKSPKSEEYTQLRTTMLSSMLAVLANNARRGVRDVQVAEVGRVFYPKDGNTQPEERNRVAIAMMGSQWRRPWSLPGDAVESDFYSLKGAVELLAGELSDAHLEFVPAEHPSLHPGRTAKVLADGQELGILGEVSAQVAGNYDLPGRAYLAELDFDLLQAIAHRALAYRPLSRFPATRRDLAILVDEGISAERVEQIMRAAAGEYLEGLALFDVYTGKQVPAGKKSLAFAFTFRAAERTLTDQEVDQAMAAVRRALEEQAGAQLR